VRERPVTPLIATDVIIELCDRPGRPIVLIERKNTPHGWALPGGFVDVGEQVEVAALREAREETGLEVHLQELLGVYSHPLRDPRGHTISVVYVGIAIGDPRADDDARAVAVTQPDAPPAPLVFDHGPILNDYLRLRETGRTAGPAQRSAPAALEPYVGKRWPSS
jgi:8-oxo-dGTP diphosphatase